MNIVNRLLMILILIALLIVFVAILLVTLGWTEPATLAPNDWFQRRLADFQDLSGSDWNWALAVSIAVIVISLILLVLELMPGRREPSRLVVKQDGMGRVTMSLDSIRNLVDWEAAQESGVLESQSQVREEPDGLRVHSRVSLEPKANAAEVTEHLQERIRSSIEQRIGKHVSQVTVDSQLEPLSGDRNRRRVR